MTREVVVLPSAVAQKAKESPDSIFVIDAQTGVEATYGEVYEAACRWANALRDLGVGPGDRVATMAPTSIATYEIWIGVALLGAIEVPINTSYRGRMLRHVLNDCQASVLCAHSRFLPQVAEVAAELGSLKKVVRLTEDEGDQSVSIEVVSADLLLKAASADDSIFSLPAPEDVALIVYTSGTTGPSKGVMTPWAQLFSTAVRVFPEGTYQSDDVFYGPYPANHVSGRMPGYTAVAFEIPAVIRDSFSTEAFWRDVDSYGCTTMMMVEAIARFMEGQEPSEADAGHTLKNLMMMPILPAYREFAERFDVRLCTVFNMSEISVPFGTEWGIEDPLSCGSLREGFPGYEVRIVDEKDRPVGPHEIGELICRTNEPWTLNLGYYNLPEKTAESWRNGWFHTGDAFKYDEEGRYFFVDRIKDAIRRRGENVSSFEVEQEVLDHPDVRECAVVAHPSEVGEDDIKVFIVRTEDSQVTPEALYEFLKGTMTKFMVPRYIEFVAALPRTQATQRIQKAELRAKGNSDETWDAATLGVGARRGR